jgi:agmatinase
MHLGPEDNFLGLEEPFCSFDRAKYTIQSAPYEHTSSYKRGSAQGPKAILEASHYVEFYDIELNGDVAHQEGISVVPPLDFRGKVNEDALLEIERSTELLLKNNKRIWTLGAEHTISLGCVRAFRKRYGQDMGILQIDAHSDLRMEYEGNPLSHACVMARIHEMNHPLFQVGIRAQCEEEANLIKTSENIHTWYDYLIQKTDLWMDEVVSRLPEYTYVTIDADGLNPTMMPEVGTAEPGGLNWYTTLEFMKKVFQNTRVVGMDFVEICPEKGGRTAYNAAQLIYKLTGYWNQWN